MGVSSDAFMHGYYIRTKLLEALGVKQVPSTAIAAHQPPEQAANRTSLELGIHQPHPAEPGRSKASGDRRILTASACLVPKEPLAGWLKATPATNVLSRLWTGH